MFGYPKVKHEIVVEHARKQYASDSDPLPEADPTLTDDNGKTITEYMQLTEDITATENGITITERRYKKPHLEKIRRQLATEKVEQAVERTVASVDGHNHTHFHGYTDWEHQQTGQRLFSSDAFNLAETHSGLSEAMDRIQDAEATGDVKAVMETHDVGNHRLTILPKRHAPSRTQRKTPSCSRKQKNCYIRVCHREVQQRLSI